MVFFWSKINENVDSKKHHQYGTLFFVRKTSHGTKEACEGTWESSPQCICLGPPEGTSESAKKMLTF